jgi:hypothetical protein
MPAMTCALVERLEIVVDPRRQGENLKHRLVDIIILGCGGSCTSPLLKCTATPNGCFCLD